MSTTENLPGIDSQALENARNYNMISNLGKALSIDSDSLSDSLPGVESPSKGRGR